MEDTDFDAQFASITRARLSVSKKDALRKKAKSKSSLANRLKPGYNPYFNSSSISGGNTNSAVPGIATTTVTRIAATTATMATTSTKFRSKKPNKLRQAVRMSKAPTLFEQHHHHHHQQQQQQQFRFHPLFYNETHE